MFYCGYDPGFEAYLLHEFKAPAEAPPLQPAGMVVAVLLALAVVGFCLAALP
jgi:hypothetical protein